MSPRGALSGVWYPSFYPGFTSAGQGDIPVFGGAVTIGKAGLGRPAPPGCCGESSETPQPFCERGSLALPPASFRSDVHLEAMEGL